MTIASLANPSSWRTSLSTAGLEDPAPCKRTDRNPRNCAFRLPECDNHLPEMPTEEGQLAALFAGKSIPEQKALLARLERTGAGLERAGAGLDRAWAAGETDENVKAALLEAADREEANARVIESA